MRLLLQIAIDLDRTTPPDRWHQAIEKLPHEAREAVKAYLHTHSMRRAIEREAFDLDADPA
jgi:hypothetical protein